MNSTLTAADIISLLKLEPLPGEGGFFAETYRAGESLPVEAIGYSPVRSLATAIYYLLTPESFSAMHVLTSDEVFHFYLGDPVEMLQLTGNGTGQRILLGTDLEHGLRPQVVVPKGTWQGSRLVPGGRFALLGTTMSPGFEFADYQPGTRAALAARYPEFTDLITALTRE